MRQPGKHPTTNIEHQTSNENAPFRPLAAGCWLLNVRRSFPVNPIHLPERVLVKRIGQLQQILADQKKEEPGDQNAEGALRHTEKLREGESLPERPARQFFQADGAEHAVVVFGDTFAAEKLFAFGTTRHSFTGGVIEATLVGQILHNCAE
jgi:hypothetical protein